MLVAAMMLQSWYTSIRRARFCRPVGGPGHLRVKARNAAYMLSHDRHHCRFPLRLPCRHSIKPSSGIPLIMANVRSSPRSSQERGAGRSAWIGRLCRLGCALKPCFLQLYSHRSHMFSTPSLLASLRSPPFTMLSLVEPQRCVMALAKAELLRGCIGRRWV